ncbi:hypothetical protein Tco_0842075 [Tanacetum coccineum]|uniref:Uncharacterized protein n=1 Tax=Tanacetum coccineum TaxID=301880 RepID=A0ABQ5AZI7_9ASTR
MRYRRKFSEDSMPSTTKKNPYLSLCKETRKKLIEQEASEIKNKFSTPRRSTMEDADNGILDEMDVIPNEEMLLLRKLHTLGKAYSELFLYEKRFSETEAKEYSKRANGTKRVGGGDGDGGGEAVLGSDGGGDDD